MGWLGGWVGQCWACDEGGAAAPPDRPQLVLARGCDVWALGYGRETAEPHLRAARAVAPLWQQSPSPLPQHAPLWARASAGRRSEWRLLRPPARAPTAASRGRAAASGDQAAASDGRADASRGRAASGGRARRPRARGARGAAAAAAAAAAGGSSGAAARVCARSGRPAAWRRRRTQRPRAAATRAAIRARRRARGRRCCCAAAHGWVRRRGRRARAAPRAAAPPPAACPIQRRAQAPFQAPSWLAGALCSRRG